MKNVLVTGGAGYIGSHCCKELHRQGFNPIVIDNLETGHKENLKWGDYVIGDIGNPEHLSKCFKKFKIDAVMHFAAYAYVGESATNPLKYYENNVQKTITLLKYLLKNKVNYFIFSSSCTVYGIPESLPIDEDHELNPISPYGRTKYIVEKFLSDCSDAYGLKYISLRYFNAAGADPDGELGERHDPETHLIPNVLNAALNSRKKVKIFGTDHPTHDGTCIRDFIHVTDLAQAHVLALQKLLANKDSDVYNLGIGRGYSVRDIIEYAKKVTSRKIHTSFAERRLGDPPVLIASNKKAIQTLGWKPVYSSINSILRTAWTWHRSIIRAKFQ